MTEILKYDISSNTNKYELNADRIIVSYIQARAELVSSNEEVFYHSFKHRYYCQSAFINPPLLLTLVRI